MTFYVNDSYYTHTQTIEATKEMEAKKKKQNRNTQTQTYVQTTKCPHSIIGKQNRLNQITNERNKRNQEIFEAKRDRVIAHSSTILYVVIIINK